MKCNIDFFPFRLKENTQTQKKESEEKLLPFSLIHSKETQNSHRKCLFRKKLVFFFGKFCTFFFLITAIILQQYCLFSDFSLSVFSFKFDSK